MNKKKKSPSHLRSQHHPAHRAHRDYYLAQRFPSHQPPTVAHRTSSGYLSVQRRSPYATVLENSSALTRSDWRANATMFNQRYGIYSAYSRAI